MKRCYDIAILPPNTFPYQSNLIDYDYIFAKYDAMFGKGAAVNATRANRFYNFLLSDIANASKATKRFMDQKIDEGMSKAEALRYLFDIFNYRQHLGGYYNMELAEEDGQVYLTINTREAHYTREETTVYLCKPSDLEKVKELMLKYALPAASKKPMSDIQALDGDTTSLSFRLEDYKNFSVSSSQNLSAENRNGMSEIYSYLQSLITGEPYSSSIEKRQLHWSLNNGYTLFIEMDDNVDEECYYHIPRKYDVTVDENIHFLKADVPVDNLSAVSEFQAGEMAYDPEKKEMVIFKSDHKSDHPLMHLGVISEFDESVADLLEKMQDGQYQLY